MAASVASFAQVADWFVTTTPRSVTSLAWSAGDVIVVIGGAETATAVLANPTNANLTFGAPQASVTDGGSTESPLYVWAATAGSSQSGQTIQMTATGGLMFGFAVIVVTGASGSVANASADRTESAFTFAPTAGSVVVYAHMDWNVITGLTLTTGSGTGTERRDAGNVNNYSQYIGTWENVTASSVAFGVTDYTGTLIGRGRIEVLAAAGGTNAPAELASGTGTAYNPTVTGPVVPVPNLFVVQSNLRLG